MSKRILIVEDFTTIRNFICDTLKARGYDALGVANIQDAWATILLMPRDIGVVVSDYHMQEGTGLALLKKIKANPATRSIRVVFLSCETDPHKINEATVEGLYAWIVKPYRSATFLSTITAALESDPRNAGR